MSLSPQWQCHAFLIHYIAGGIILPETNKPVVHLTLMFLQKSKIHCKPDLLVIFSEVANKYYHISLLSFLCFHSASLLPSSKIRCILALDTRLWHTQFPFLLHKRLNPSVPSLFGSTVPPRPSVPINPLAPNSSVSLPACVSQPCSSAVSQGRVWESGIMGKLRDLRLPAGHEELGKLSIRSG